MSLVASILVIMLLLKVFQLKLKLAEFILRIIWRVLWFAYNRQTSRRTRMHPRKPFPVLWGARTGRD